MTIRQTMKGLSTRTDYTLDELSNESNLVRQSIGPTVYVSFEASGISGFFKNIIHHVRNFTLKTLGKEPYYTLSVKLPLTKLGKLNDWTQVREVVIDTPVQLNQPVLTVLAQITVALTAFRNLEANIKRISTAVVLLQSEENAISPGGLSNLDLPKDNVVHAAWISKLHSMIRFTPGRMKLSRLVNTPDNVSLAIEQFNVIDATLDGEIIASDIISAMDRLVTLTEGIMANPEASSMSGANMKKLSAAVMDLASTANALSVVMEVMAPLADILTKVVPVVEPER